MKKSLFGLLLILICTLFILAGCSDTPAPAEETKADGTTAGESAVEATAADTEAETSEDATETSADLETEAETAAEETLWTPDMGKFNDGKVTYVREVETEISSEYPDAKVGEPMKSGETGVSTVFSTDFGSDDITCGGKTALRTGGSAKIIDGVFYMSYDENSADKCAADGWTTYSIVTPASVSTYKQVELSLDWTVISRGEGTWMTAIWGVYVSQYASKIPDTPGDGLWLSFNRVSNSIVVYHPDKGSWPAGWTTIPVEPGLMDGMIHTDIVCSSDYTTDIFITGEGGNSAVKVGSIAFKDGKIRVFGADGAMIAEDDCTTDAVKGENFSLFTHAGGGVWIDKMQILGASKGQVKEKNVKVTATPAEGQKLGLDITDKTDLISINYSVWFDAILGSGTNKVTYYNNITEALAGNQPWGGSPSFHYWAKPAVGYYYRSSDKEVIRTHMTQLYEAGVDFIVIDLTNAGDGYLGNSNWTSYIETPMVAILDTVMDMRSEGKGTPYVVFWVGNSNGPLYEALYDKFHAVEKWQDCFVYWNDKPLMILTPRDLDTFPCSDLFTVRVMWGLNNDHSTNHWSFLNIKNYGTVSKDKDGNPEQVSVAVASQETYMSANSAHGRNHGIFWYTQWAYAFEVHPKIVGLTWWNEWTAQRLEVNGKYVFTDAYTQEYSRDIEPMEGGHGDTYYQWMKQYIAAYKSHKDCPVLVEAGYEQKAAKELKRVSK